MPNGPTAGGTTVSVFGTNFVEMEFFACRFGVHSVKAKFVSSTHVECIAPPQQFSRCHPFPNFHHLITSSHHIHATMETISAGSVAVTVALGDLESAHDLIFTYVQKVRIFAVNPSSGPSSGGTELVVNGRGFVFSTMLTCRFRSGDAVVSATFKSESQIRCLTPSLPPAKTSHTC